MSGGANERFSRRQTLRNTGWFLAGKILSACATIVWLAAVTRALLPHGHFGDYVSAIAYLETVLALSLFGLDWLLIRTLPAALAAGNGGGLRRLLRQTLLARAACAGLAALLLLVLASVFGTPTALSRVPLPLLAGLLLTESLLRMLRDNALESLAAQRYTQLGVLGRTLLALLGLTLLAAGDVNFDASTVLAVEFVASLLMLACSATWVAKATRDLPIGAPLAFWSGWRGCWHNYQAALISYPLAPQALLLMVSGFAGAQATAMFGLVVRVFEILRNYVPGLLLMNVLRPRLIALYAARQDFAAVAVEAQMISRWSAVSVAPLVALLGLYGDALLSLLAGQPLSGLAMPLALMSATLLLRVHRQIGQVLVNCVGELALLSRLALFGLLGWPLGLLLAFHGQPIWGAVLVLIWDETVWMVGMAAGLQRRGYAWSTQLKLLLGLLLLAGVSGSLVALLPLPQGVWGLVLGATLLLSLMLIVLRLGGLLDWRAALSQLRARD